MISDQGSFFCDCSSRLDPGCVKMGKIGIVGSGLIGRSWAMLFISAGHQVTLFDIVQTQLDTAEKDICEKLRKLEKDGSLRGTLSVDEQLQLLKFTDSLAECVKDAIYVQECVSEILDLKKKVFAQLDTFATDTMILASSSSAIPASQFTKDMAFRHRALVSHPVNPPYFMPLVEVVPAPWTAPEVVTKTRQLLKDIGQSPVTLNKEVAGFVQPRIQYAILQEALRLVADDVISGEDLDKIFTDGLGRRYSFMGMFETIHLNAEGVKNYFDRYSDILYGVASDSGPTIQLKDNPRLQTLFAEMDARVPLDQLADRRQWRDEGIAALAKLRRDMDSKEGQ